MSDSEFDIAAKIAVESSDSESERSDAEVQDEILSSDSESEKVEKPAAKKQKIAFPSLEVSDDEDNDITSYFNTKSDSAKKAKSGSFPSFGFSKFLSRNISKKGYNQPTPIQRKTIPLILANRDVVGMARTGSGKTAAFLLPLVEKLKVHSAKIGARSVVLSPSRELALQTYKQVKEFSRGTDLRTVLLIGGDSLEDQFKMMMGNPDIVVATPGRFLHLKVEMDLDLKSVEYIVYDEADRLFEMGFAEQLNELLASLPPQRQSLLFSATLPRSLVDFAKAGLQNPVLVRLDSESKISDELEMAFLAIKKNEREANLLFLLQNVIKIPLATVEELKRLVDNAASDSEEEEDTTKKRKRKHRPKMPRANVLPSKFSTIVFVPTRHHVEFITTLLKDAGFAVSYIYGTLDQHARRNQLTNFRLGLTNLLVVTDVAARGIDIPVLANVINYSVPSSSKIFVHRVGRTARAGHRGWAYSLVSESELPYLLDLEIFLARKVYTTAMHESKCRMADQEFPVPYTKRLVVGSAPRGELEGCQELYETLTKHNDELGILRGVASKGEILYYRTRQPASAESMKRSKELIQSSWDAQHLLFGKDAETEKNAFLEKLQNRRNKETVFEFSKNDDSLAEMMHKRRRQLAPVQRRAKERRELLEKERLQGLRHSIEDELLKGDNTEVGYKPVEESELLSVFQDGDAVQKKSFRDENFFISHYAPSGVVADKQLNLDGGFANQAQHATFDLQNDDKTQVHRQTMQWDKKKKRYINSKSTDQKYIISENGQKIPATYKSGKFDDWKKSNKVGPMRLGAPELSSAVNTDKRVKHKQMKSPKLPDKSRLDYHKQKKKVEKAVESGRNVRGFSKPGQSNGLRSTEDIRKHRELQERRKAKNARPTKKRR